MTKARCANSLRVLLTGLIDYAGLFPPAALAMKTAVENFEAYRRDDLAWILGRFIVPASLLIELEACVTPATTEIPWRISALMDTDLEGDLAMIHAFNQRQAGRAVIDSVEFKADGDPAIRHAAALIPKAMACYCEIPVGRDPLERIEAIAVGGLRAKIRTGGVIAASFPSAAQVARFVARCAGASVAFKATAGLHHPLRGEFQLTYEPDSPRATMHGFLGLFLAAAFVRIGWTMDRLVPLIEETDAKAFKFDDAGANWRGHSITTDQLQKTRNQVAVSFGSCSFTEPVGDLQTLRLL